MGGSNERFVWEILRQGRIFLFFFYRKVWRQITKSDMVEFYRHKKCL